MKTSLLGKTPTNTKAARPGGKTALKTSSYAKEYYKNLEASQAAQKMERPSPKYYFSTVFGALPHHSHNKEWALVCCCFHPDRNPSLSVNLKSGGYFCHSCEAKGGDLISFHRQYNDVDFPTAVAQLKVLHKEEKSCL